MTKGLTGIPSLAYLGVNAGSPPNIRMYKRSPTTRDWQNFIIGDLWINITPTPTTAREIWMLVATTGAGTSATATWVQLYPIAGGGGGNLRSDDALISIPDGLGAINVTGGQPYAIGSDAWLNDPVYSNIFTAANPVNNTLEIVLKRSIMQPLGTADGTRGLYGIDGNDFMHAFGTGNTMLGIDAGNRTLNVGAAINNTCIGYNTLQSIDTSNHCTGVGFNVFSTVFGGSHLIGLGQNAGLNYVLNESSDILIGNPGIVGGGEDNVIRIGVMGNGLGEQNQCFIAGIWNSPAVPVVNTGLVIVDDSGQLYVDDLDANSVIMTDAGGNPVALKGAAGTVLTGRGAAPADPAPEFLPLTSAAGTVTISTDPVTGSINLEAAGVAGLTQLTTDTGVALPLAGNINVLGGELINTDNLVANTVTVNLDQGTDGTVVVGHTGLPSDYQALISTDGSINIDFTNPFGVDFKMVGVPPVGGVNQLTAHTGGAVPPTSNNINIEQGDNIETTGVPATSTITVRVTDNVTLAGYLHAAGEIETTGVGSSLIADFGHLILPNTDVGGFGGTVQFGGTRWISNYGTSNVFVGPNAGSLALNVASAKDCTFVGKNVGAAHTQGESNTAVGSGAFDVNASGAQCTILGVSAFGQDTGSSYSTCLGWHAGYNAAGSNNNSCLYIDNVGVNGESNVIRIGQEGTSAHHQDKCYIAGIYGHTPGATPQMVTIGNDGKLGTAGLPAVGARIFNTDSGTANVSGTTIKIKGGANINTSGAGNIVTVNLDTSILQPYSPTSSNYGVYAIGSTSYNTDRFLHSWCYNQTPPTNIYAGYQAGRINTGAIGFKNVGIGYQALDAVTAANTVTAVGYQSGTNLTSGANSTYLGASSGSVYTTESNNITLNHAGVAGDSRVMRLGFNTQWNYVVDKTHPDGVFTKTVTGVDEAYLYGAYNATLDSSAMPMYVDKTGKLGTNGSCMFAYRQTTTITNATGDGTVYDFGTAGGITIDFDNTSSLSYDGSSRLIFTAPYPGKYCFVGTVMVRIPASPPIPAPVRVDPIWLITSGHDYCFSSYIPASTTFAQYVSEIVTAIVYLDRYDTARFACAVGQKTDVKNINIVSTPGGIPSYPSGVTVSNATHFLGYRIA